MQAPDSTLSDAAGLSAQLDQSGRQCLFPLIKKMRSVCSISTAYSWEPSGLPPSVQVLTLLGFLHLTPFLPPLTEELLLHFEKCLSVY